MTIREGVQLVQNLLLIGIGRDIHGTDFSVVGAKIFLGLQRSGQPLFLIFGIVLKFSGVPAALEYVSDLVNGLQQISAGNFHIPFQASGDSNIGLVRSSHIGTGKAEATIKNIVLGVKLGTLCVVADLVEMFPPLSATFYRPFCNTSARYYASTLDASALSMGNLRASEISESSQY